MTKEEKKKILNEMPSNYELGSNLENSIHLIQERIFMLNKRLDTIEILLWFISVFYRRWYLRIYFKPDNRINNTEGYMDDKELRLKCLEIIALSKTSYDITEMIFQAEMAKQYIEENILPFSKKGQISFNEVIKEAYKTLFEESNYTQKPTDDGNDNAIITKSKAKNLLFSFRHFGRKIFSS